jgi:uncharacterized protein YggE
MKRMAVYLLALLLPFGLQAQVNTIPSAPHLLVRGHAETNYIPDRFSITLKVQVTDPQPERARQRVEAHMAAIFRALAKADAMKGRTQASTLQIGPDNEYRNDKEVFVGTQVTRSVVAVFDAMSGLRAFLASLPAGDEVQVTGVESGCSDLAAITLSLRKQAMINSQEAARQMASAYGARIIGLYSVSDVAPNFPYGVEAGSWQHGDRALLPPPPPGSPVLAESTAPDLRVGTQQAEQDVYAIYLIGTP